jgi:hypothetical protein
MVKHHHHTTNYSFYIFRTKDLDLGRKKKGGAGCTVRKRWECFIFREKKLFYET